MLSLDPFPQDFLDVSCRLKGSKSQSCDLRHADRYQKMASRFLCLVFFRAAAVDWSEIFENQSPGRHLQSLPDGFEINQTMNGTIPLTVVPSWDIFLSFSDRQKYIKGRMSLATIYPEIATTFVEHPEHMVDVVNFGSGSGDINTMSSLKLWDPKSGKTATTVSKTYVGEFSQSLYPYDSLAMFWYIVSFEFRRFLEMLQAGAFTFFECCLTGSCRGSSCMHFLYHKLYMIQPASFASAYQTDSEDAKSRFSSINISYRMTFSMDVCSMMEILGNC